METSILIAIISLIGVIVNSFILHSNNKDKNKVHLLKNGIDARNTEMIIARELMEELRITVEEHKKKIKDLSQEIGSLKQKENFHKIEKLRLEEKISKLVQENKELKIKVSNNQTMYKKEIEILKDKIKTLSRDLNNYTDEHP